MKTLSLFCINVFCHGAWVMNFPWHYFLCHCTSTVCPLLSWRHNCEKHWVVLYCPITEVFFLTFCVFWEQGCLQRRRETIYAAGCSCAHEWVVEARNRTQQSVQTQTQCSRGPNPLLDTVVLTDRLRHRHVASDRNLACTFLIRHKTLSEGAISVCIFPQQLCLFFCTVVWQADFDISNKQCLVPDRNLACTFLIRHKTLSEGAVSVCVFPQQLSLFFPTVIWQADFDVTIRQCLVPDRNLACSFLIRHKMLSDSVVNVCLHPLPEQLIRPDSGAQQCRSGWGLSLSLFG